MGPFNPQTCLLSRQTQLPSLSRLFTTTSQSQSRSSRNQLRNTHRDIPPYPHGPSLVYKKANFGLISSKKPHYGNTVSEKNENKNRRRWELNLQEKRLYSEILGHFVRVKIQARVLRTIDKVGGLDEYLLGESPGRIKELGMEGWRLRWILLQTEKGRERVRRRRIELGVPPDGPERWYGDEELLRDDAEEGSSTGKDLEVRVENEAGRQGVGWVDTKEEDVDRLRGKNELERQRRDGEGFMYEKSPRKQLSV